MWMFLGVAVLIYSSVSGYASAAEKTFHKCCPKSQGLIQVFEDETVRYECSDRESAFHKYNVSNPLLIIGDSVTVESSIPDSCDELQMVPLSEMETDTRQAATSQQCYDRLLAEVVNGTSQRNIPKTVKLICIHNETEASSDPKFSIDLFRKCCPEGQSYDMYYHLCRKGDNNSSENWLLRNLKVSDTSIYEVESGLHCKPNQFAVELSEVFYNIELLGDNLNILKKSGDSGGRALHGEWCVEREFEKENLIARVCTPDCEAYGAYCVRKCCPVGQHYRTNTCSGPISTCVQNEDDVFFDLTTYLEPIKYYGLGDVMGIKTGLRCSYKRMMLNKSLDSDVHALTTTGDLESPLASDDKYCLETFDNRHCPGGSVWVTGIICFVKAQDQHFAISFWLIAASSVCLALTLIVYCSLSELRNLHGLNLICHVSMMLLAFICLARVQYSYIPDRNICTMFGYGIYFGFMGAFAWLNVMCLDIWWTFGSMRVVQTMRKTNSEKRRFLWYSLYAWSITAGMTLTTFLLDKYPVAKFLDANIGTGMCWFSSEQNSRHDWPHYIFFVIPMGVGTGTNFVLFLLTARHCARVKSEVHRMQAGSVGDRAKKRFRVDKAKYILTGKLWVVMGAGWISELLSTLAVNPQWLWYIVDSFNELQGVFIFFILIFKPKLYYLIRKRLGLEKPDPHKQGGSSTARTSSTFLSRTISSDERATLRISNGNNIKQP